MENHFKNIGIIYNPDFIESKNLALKINSKIQNSKISSFDKPIDNVDLVFAIGGDGTFLKLARHYCKTNTPILGFNVGRLGYLTQAKPDDIDLVFEKLESNDYKIQDRLMLKAKDNLALNDIVIKGHNCARTSTLDLLINDKKVCSYVADGLIIATPTGSTAYSLSAGGPIVSPYVDCFLIIPICPHTLNARPIVVPSNEKITIRTVEENEKLNVSFDGQVDIEINNEITIEKNENYAKLLILNQQKDKFYDILKEKLHWSLSPRK